MKQKNYALTTFLLLVAAGTLAAQEPYTLSVGSGTYRDLDAPIVTIKGLDTNDYGITQVDFEMEVYGFPLKIKGDQTSIVFFREGYVGFSGVDSKNRNVIISLEAFYALLTPRDSTSARSMQIDGTGNDQIMKFEWKNMGLKGNPASDYVNFQAWMKKKDNSLEVHIGPSRVTARGGYFGNLTGPVIGLLLASPNLSTIYHTAHLSGHPTNPQFPPVAFIPLDSTPPNGTIYRFTYNRQAGVEETSSAGGVKFLPNPFNDATVLELPEELNGGMLIVHDMLGREVLRLENAKSGDRIERGSLPPGAYLVTHRNGERSRFCGRIVVAE